MKKIIALALLYCCHIAVFGQVTYSLRIMDVHNLPLKNVEATAQNKEKNILLKGKTDENGSVDFVLIEAGVYTFSYLNMKDVKTFELVAGVTGKSRHTVTYDPEKVFEWQAANRTGITFKNVAALALKEQPNVAKVTLEVLRNDKTKVSDVKLELVDTKNKTKYQTTTNAVGVGVFYVPMSIEYEIDVAGTQALQRFTLPNHPNFEYQQTVYYEKTNVNETAKGDTILQKQITQTEGTSTHLLFTISLKDYDDHPLADEVVYLCDVNGKRVYEGHTDAQGACKFMLQKGTNYLINLRYEQGVHLLEAKDTKGFTTASETTRYRGSKTIEKMMAERHLNEKGFVVNHAETPVRPAPKPTNYLKKTDVGFDVDFATSGPVGTPTIAENKLFTQQGFYSPNFYCLEAATGQYLWGVELGESGTSPAVYLNGVLLINTYSCTLYALQASTGKLLWSKWLAGTIYSTPSADSNSVYVVYNNGGANPQNKGESFVVTSFDLHTGKMNWINWLDNEVIACPVVEGGEVHIASQSGSYYVFDKSSGKPKISSHAVKAISSPTVTRDNIYITASLNGKEQLVVLDRKTLQIKKKYTTPLAPRTIPEDHSCYAQMNFNGAHPIVYKNKVVLLLDSTKVTAFDATSEKMLWQQTIKTNPSQIPIVANEKVIIASQSGDIISYDMNTGASQTIQQKKSATDGQPVLFNGSMYLGSAEVLEVSKSSQKFSWNQWNKDARHNPYWE